MQVYTMMLSSIYPVHIGSGELYTPIEYAQEIDKGKSYLHRISIERFVAGLSEKDASDFIDCVRTPNFNLTQFAKGMDLKSSSRYRMNCFEKPNMPDKIREAIKTNDLPYIPGTSIKGMLRTALLWDYVQNDPSFIDSIRKDWKFNYKKFNYKYWMGNEYVAQVFDTRGDTCKRPDPKFDLFKFVEVSDFMPQRYFIQVENVKTYSRVKNRNGVTLQDRNFPQFCEYVIGDFAGTISLSPQIKPALRSSSFPKLQQKLALLGLLESLESNVMVDHLFSKVRAFQDWALQRELNLVRGCGLPKLEKIITELIEKNRTHYLIRLGFGIGTTYQTVIGVIEEKDPELAAQIINQLHIGKYERHINGITLSPPYPKSIECIEKTYEPLGWMEWSSSS
jgi:CRISPR/Cas system CSM-associated protein Csm5 (group 7 of RAMP superfamily)